MRPRAFRAGAAGAAAPAALAVALAVAAAAVAAAPGAAAQVAGGPEPLPAPGGAEVLEIGVLLPLTGDLSGLGAWMDAAVDKSAADLNERLARDGAGWSVRLTKADTGTDPAAALEAARGMRDAGIELVAGPAASAGVEAVRGLADEDGMVFLSCCSSASFLAVPGDSIFRLSPNNTVVASFAAHRMLGAGADAAVVAHRGDPWGEELASAAAAAFDEGSGRAGSAVAVRYDPDGDPLRVAAEIDGRLAALGAAGIQRAAVLLVGFEETAGILASAGETAQESPASASRMEAAAWFGINVYDEIAHSGEAAAFAERVGYGGILAGPDASHPMFAGVGDYAIAAASPGEERADPDVFTSYDAVQILAAAASAAGSSDGAAVAAAVPAAAASYRGLSGDTSLNAAGDRNSAIFEVWTVKGGGWTAGGGAGAGAGGEGDAMPPGAAAAEGGGCLVATAAYGTELAPDVQALRELRDAAMLSGPAGPALVHAFHTAYYAVSPPAADLLREHPQLGGLVGAAAVAPAVHALRAAQAATDGPIAGAAAALALAAAVAAAAAAACAANGSRHRGPARRSRPVAAAGIPGTSCPPLEDGGARRPRAPCKDALRRREAL